MLVLPLQQDRELSSLGIILQGLLLFDNTNSINSMGSVYHTTLTTVGTRP